MAVFFYHEVDLDLEEFALLMIDCFRYYFARAFLCSEEALYGCKLSNFRTALFIIKTCTSYIDFLEALS